MFIKSNKNAFNRSIPDENNISNFDLDYFDIFNINRLSGFDRFDNLSRVDYGLKIENQGNKLVSEVSVGQSYQLNNTITFKLTRVYQKNSLILLEIKD